MICKDCGKKMKFNPYKDDHERVVRRWFCKEGCGLMSYEEDKELSYEGCGMKKEITDLCGVE